MLVAALVAGGLVLTFSVLLLVQRQPSRDESAPVRSPVPWIGDAVWRDLFSRGAPPRRLLIGGRMINRPEVVGASDDDRLRAPTAPVFADSKIPPPGSWQEQRQRLLTTPGPSTIHSPVWPLCCDRLACLEYRQGRGRSLEDLEASAGPLDRAFLGAELSTWGGPNADRASLEARGWSEILALIRTGTHRGEGIHIYQCRACGRLYVASTAP